MLDRFQKFQEDDNPSLNLYTYEPKPFFYGSLTDHRNCTKFSSLQDRQSSNWSESAPTRPCCGANILLW
jgi:hypothetical protein